MTTVRSTEPVAVTILGGGLCKVVDVFDDEDNDDDFDDDDSILCDNVAIQKMDAIEDVKDE